jgi:signal transduction histidine kinase
MDRPCAAQPRSGQLLDVVIAALALGGTVAVLSHGFTVVPGSSPGLRGLDGVSGLLAVCASMPLIAWRRSPLGVFVLTASASALLGGLGYAVGVPLGATAALYLLAASRDESDPWDVRTTVVAIALLGAYLSASALGEGRFPGTELFHTALAWGVAWFAGERTRLRRAHIAELRDRALRAEREAEHERRLAVAEERARIARDLHDSAGHAINVIAVRAGAARLGHDREPDRTRRALEAIEEMARQTVAEIDEIVGSLRDERVGKGLVAAPPGLASVDTLVAHHTSAGLDLRLRTTGAARRLAATTDRAAYRILQEALTNAARHGAGTATIDLVYDKDALELTVVNPVPASTTGHHGGGHGLVGMRERATLVGGSLDAARANGAFRVHAHLPYRGQRCR